MEQGRRLEVTSGTARSLTPAPRPPQLQPGQGGFAFAGEGVRCCSQWMGHGGIPAAGRRRGAAGAQALPPILGDPRHGERVG